MKKGIESLLESVKKDCQAENCLTPSKCSADRACTSRYWGKYVWILNRAQEYASLIGVTKEEVLEKWEEKRSYWYMNYYQDCNQPKISGNVLLVDKWLSILKEQFGEDPLNWKFVCPSCGHIQSLADFKEIGVEPQNAYINCIGRYKKDAGGCDWSINGLFSINKTTVISEDFIPTKVFEIATDK